MFSRFLVGDLFLHGIGGAKYDELGDSISRSFFGIEPPAFSTLSLTLWLGLADSPSTRADLRRIDRSIRSLTYNPDRHLTEPISGELRSWVEAKRAAIAGPVLTRTERVARFPRSANAIPPFSPPFPRLSKLFIAITNESKPGYDSIRSLIIANSRQ